MNKVGPYMYNGYVGVGSAGIHFWITQFYCRVDPKPTPPSLDNDLTIIQAIQRTVVVRTLSLPHGG